MGLIQVVGGLKSLRSLIFEGNYGMYGIHAYIPSEVAYACRHAVHARKGYITPAHALYACYFIRSIATHGSCVRMGGRKLAFGTSESKEGGNLKILYSILCFFGGVGRPDLVQGLRLPVDPKPRPIHPHMGFYALPHSECSFTNPDIPGMGARKEADGTNCDA